MKREHRVYILSTRRQIPFSGDHNDVVLLSSLTEIFHRVAATSTLTVQPCTALSVTGASFASVNHFQFCYDTYGTTCNGNSPIRFRDKDKLCGQ